MPDDSTKLTNLQLLRLAQGLASLDGLRTKADEFRPYEFGFSDIWAISNNIEVVTAKVTVFNRAKKALAAQYKVSDHMQVTAENAENVKAFMDGAAALEDQEVEVSGLIRIKRDSLKVGHERGKNPIPPSVLAALLPLLDL